MKLLILILSSILLFSCNNKYQKLSKKDSDVEVILKKIQPDKNIKYWQLESFPNYSDDKIDYKIKFSKGKITKTEAENIRTIKRNGNGFFEGCQPLYCGYRITYLENGKWFVVNSEDDLKNFIGKIDNEYEAFLIGIINNYSIDEFSEKGNGFIKENVGYSIKMMKFETCPVTKESFSIYVGVDGKISSLKSNGFYLKSKDCWTY